MSSFCVVDLEKIKRYGTTVGDDGDEREHNGSYRTDYY